MKIGGQIPWNVTPVCETSQISCLMGRRPIKDALENLSKDKLFHLVHWLSITLFLRKISQESINLERKSYLDCSSDTHCTRGDFGRVMYWSQTLRIADDGRIGNLLKKTQCERGDIPKGKRRIYCSNRRLSVKMHEICIHNIPVVCPFLSQCLLPCCLDSVTSANVISQETFCSLRHVSVHLDCNSLHMCLLSASCHPAQSLFCWSCAD